MQETIKVVVIDKVDLLRLRVALRVKVELRRRKLVLRLRRVVDEVHFKARALGARRQSMADCAHTWHDDDERIFFKFDNFTVRTNLLTFTFMYVHSPPRSRLSAFARAPLNLRLRLHVALELDAETSPQLGGPPLRRWLDDRVTPPRPEPRSVE